MGRFAPIALAELMTPRLENVAASAFKDYAPITVHLDGEISVRKRATPYKGAMFAAHPGDIVFSKIDARSGAIGVVPSDIGPAVVTPEFPVFMPDLSRLDATFMRRILRTGELLRALARKASGTSGRKRVTPNGFLSIAIPLPPIEEQLALVAAYDAALNEAAGLETSAAKTEADGLAAFEAALGLTPPTPLPDVPRFIAKFSDMDRWSHEAVLRQSIAPQAAATTYPMLPVGTFGKVSYGIQKCPDNRPDLHPRPYLRVANVQRWRLDLYVIKQINVPDSEMHRYRLEDGDVLLCEGNSPDLVGRGAIWRSEIADCVHQNHVLRIRLDPNVASPEFVLSVINSLYGQAYFRSKSKRTTNLASINSKEVASFPVPLPSLPEQLTLFAALSATRQKAAALRQQAAAKRADAWTAFEAAIYGA